MEQPGLGPVSHTSPGQPPAAQPNAEPSTPDVPTVESSASADVEKQRSRPAGPKTPKWETEARERLRSAIRKLSKPLQDLIDRDANEGDTRHFVTDILVDGLGYDKYADLTTEYQVKGDFADYGIRIDKQLAAFVEVKRCTQRLGEKHLKQAQGYAVNEGVEWIILTNGQTWQAYHVTGGLPVSVDLAFEVDLLGEATLAEKANQLFYLTRESFKRRQIDELWEQIHATSPGALARVLLSDPVVEATRKEIRRQSNQKVTPAQIREILTSTVIREDSLD